MTELLLVVPKGRILRIECVWEEEDPAHPSEEDPEHWRPKPLGGDWRFVMQFRRAPGETGRPVLHLSSDPAGGIVVEPDGRPGVLDVTVGATATAVMEGQGRYELAAFRVGDPDDAPSLAEGPWVVDPMVVVP